MNPRPDGLGSSPIALERRSPLVVEAEIGTPASLTNCGKVHAVPVRDVVAASGRLADALCRIFEMLVASIGLLVALPIMLIEGREIEGRTDLLPPSGGYEPDQLYYVPSYFRLVKFRTMHHDARIRFPELYSYEFPPGEFREQRTTHQRDLRVTRIGEIYKFACKPGITGLAQINGRGLLSWGEVLAWDLRYIRTRSVELDLKVMFTTLKYVTTRRGAF